MNSTEDILEKGFQLAYFIFPSRSHAVMVLTGALNKLKSQHGRESRRTYWRDKYLKRGITRITREEGDMLQWLIFYESDHYEKEQEAAHGAPSADMVLRYIKSLVRITSAMSSFHVNIGLHRLLHNYSTTEVQQVYESITERFLGADEYRRAKSVLMSKLEDRFDGMLKTSRSQHGEIRFVPFDQQAQWAELVDLCLKEFTPWSTRNTCPVPINFGEPEHTLPANLSGKGSSEADHNQIEINRCHVFIDPLCFGRLARALAIDPPANRLDLPRFFMEKPADSNFIDRPPQPPQLSAEERKSIADFAVAQAERRQKTAPTVLAILIDGKEHARLATSGNIASRQLEIHEGAELIEIWTEAESKSLLLATHKIAYSETHGIAPANVSFRFKGAAELDLQISGNDQAQTSPRVAIVSLVYLPGPQNTGMRWAWATPKFALTSIALIAFGWILTMNTVGKHATPPISLQQTPAGYIESSKALLPPEASPTPAEMAQANPLPSVYKLIPDELATRGSGATEMPSIVVPAQATLIELELPIISTDAARSFHATLKTFSKGEEILTVARLTAKQAPSGRIVTFSLPSTILEADEDYTVDLRTHYPGGRMEELSSYTFHTVKSSSKSIKITINGAPSASH